MLKLFLWLRYLRKKRIVLLSIVAVALSVALLVASNSLFTSFLKALEETDLSGRGDIILSPRLTTEYEPLIERIGSVEYVEGVSLLLTDGGLLRLGSGDVQEVFVYGVDDKRAGGFGDLKKALLRQGQNEGEVCFEMPGHPDQHAGWVGIALLAEPDETTDEYDMEHVRSLIGNTAHLMIPGRVTDESGADDGEAEKKWKLNRKTVKFRISDVVFSGQFLRDRMVYFPYEELYAISFGDEEIRATNLKIDVAEGVDLISVRDEVWRVWETYATGELGRSQEEDGITWIWSREDEDETDYLSDLREMMQVLTFIFGTICSVAMLLIFCIFYVIVMTRQKDVAIIKSCGAGSLEVASIFLGYGACVGLVGSGLGIVIGYLATRYIETLADLARVLFGMRVWRSSAMWLGGIPNDFHWDSLVWIVPAATGACLVGALLPALVAARVEPVKILRYE